MTYTWKWLTPCVIQMEMYPKHSKQQIVHIHSMEKKRKLTPMEAPNNSKTYSRNNANGPFQLECADSWHDKRAWRPDFTGILHGTWSLVHVQFSYLANGKRMCVCVCNPFGLHWQYSPIRPSGEWEGAAGSCSNYSLHTLEALWVLELWLFAWEYQYTQ